MTTEGGPQPPATSADPARINEDKHGAQRFVLEPADNDKLVQTGQQIIMSCQLTTSVKVWLDELADMISWLSKWAADRSNRIQGMICAPRPARVMLFVVPQSGRFDFDLADELVEMVGRVEDTFNIGTIEAVQVPADEIDRFVGENEGKVVYGQRPAPHQPMDA